MPSLDNPFLCLVVLTSLICPPLATAILCGCTPDILLNFVFCFFGWLPAVCHVFYLTFIAYDRRTKVKKGLLPLEDAPMVFSQRIQNAGKKKVMMKQQSVAQTDTVVAADVDPAGERLEPVISQQAEAVEARSQ